MRPRKTQSWFSRLLRRKTVKSQKVYPSEGIPVTDAVSPTIEADTAPSIAAGEVPVAGVGPTTEGSWPPSQALYTEALGVEETYVGPLLESDRVHTLSESEASVKETGAATKVLDNGSTGFFELPAELRDAIYEYLLPLRRQIDYYGAPLPSGTFSIEDRWIANLCQADSRFKFDLHRVQPPRPVCRFVVSPKGCQLPNDLDMKRYKRIEIYIDHYDLKAFSGNDSHRIYYAVSGGFYTMRAHLRRFVNHLRAYEQLPDITIMFREAPLEGLYGDLHWIQDARWPGLCARVPAGISEGYRHRIALVWYLLHPILRLPPAGSAFIQPWRCLTADDDSTTSATFPKLTSALCSALGEWLQGSRDSDFEDLLRTRVAEVTGGG